MTQTSDQNSASSSPATGDHLKNLENLHRMSRTAGLGTTEYAAVNVAAVVTLIIGGASFLAMLTPVFLFLPVVGLVIGFIALKQILGSSGTQTGLLLAVLGVLACIGFSAVTGYQLVHARQVQAEDERKLTALIERFGSLLAAEKYDDAYQLLDARLRERVSKAEFKQFFTQRMIPELGKVRGFSSNGLFLISEASDDASVTLGKGIALVETERLQGNQRLRPDVVYRKVQDEWMIFSIPEWFQSSTAKEAPLPAGPSGPPVPGQ